MDDQIKGGDQNLPEGSEDGKNANSPDEFIHEFNSGIIRKTEYFDLFISYKRDNGGDHGQKLAEELHEKLTADGYKVWIDNEEIGFSNNFEQRIEEALLHSKKILCIIGPAWVESPNCRYEIKKAIEFEKRLIPVHYQEFRELLKAKQTEGELTVDEWNRVDKPQEVDFSSPEKHRKGYEDIKALCALHDDITEQHNEFLCNAYYWRKYKSPKSMLLTGTAVSKAKLVRDKCDSDGELPNFSALQNDFVTASQEFVAKEVSNKRNVYIAYSDGEYDEAAELNMELKLHGITTWFENDAENTKGDDSFVEAIIKCENVLEVITKKSAPEDSLKIAFARSNNKRVIKVASSQAIVDDHAANNEKNIYLWNGQVRIDDLITTISGDKVYNGAHSKLLEEAYEWEKSSKSNSKLLALKEARVKKEWYKEAEEKGIEPQPNLSMVNFVELSVAYGETLRKRRIGLLWTAALGIILILILGFSAWKLQGTANDAIKDAEVASELAIEKQNEAVKAQEDAEIAKSEADQAQKDAEVAKEEADLAQESAKKAKHEASVAKSQAAVAKEQAKLAQADAAVAKAEAKVAQAEAAEAIESLDETRKALEIAKIEADSISFITQGRISALKASEAQQARDTEAAIENANQAVSFLTDSVAASAQIQSLYDVYTELIPSNSILNLDRNKEERTEDELVKLLEDSNEIPKKKYPETILVEEINGVPIEIGYDANSAEKSEALSVINKLDNKADVSALCISPDGTKLAIGYKGGSVEIWDLDKQENVGVVLNHSYRVTTIAFSPQGNELAIASIDENFSIVKLTSEGKKDRLSENVKMENGSRIIRLYYWNDNHIITVSWNDFSKIWGTDVEGLKAEIQNK